MGSLQDAIATPVVIALTDGSDYTFTLIGLDQWCEFCQWLNVQEGRRATHVVSMDEMLEGASTIPGMRWLVWKSLQEHHRGLHINKLGELIGGLDQLSEIVGQIMALPEPEGSDPPKLVEASP